MPRASVILFASVFFLILHGQVSGEGEKPVSLDQLSFEELFEVSIVSASRTPEKLSQAPATVIVINREEILERGVMSEEQFDEAAALGKALFAEGRRWAESRGLILVDTKYELGVDDAGQIVVIDEIHTPDSSRYWYRESYERALSQGGEPQALDKEYVRRWLGEQGYKGDGKPPEIALDVRCEAARRYIEAYEQLTGREFKPDVEPPEQRIRRNLGL